MLAKTTPVAKVVSVPSICRLEHFDCKHFAEIEVSLVGVNNLYLVVEDGGNGDGGDHGGWFDPVLTNREGQQVPLTKLKWKSATQGWGKTEVNKAPNGEPLQRADPAGRLEVLADGGEVRAEAVGGGRVLRMRDGELIEA